MNELLTCKDFVGVSLVKCEYLWIDLEYCFNFELEYIFSL